MLSTLLPELELPSSARAVCVSGIDDDSRNIKEGDLFCAVSGEKNNGEAFVASAVEKGANAIVSESESGDVHGHWLEEAANTYRLYIPNLRSSLSAMAGAYYGHPSKDLFVAGVTGTNGKTSCVHFLKNIWNGLGYSSASIGTIGVVAESDAPVETGMTTPGPIKLQRELNVLRERGITHVAIEVSSHGIHQGRVEALCFSAKMLTNITRDHLDYHGTFEAYAQTKLDFINKGVERFSVVNIDDPSGAAYKLSGSTKNTLFYSLGNKGADLYFSTLSASESGFAGKLVSPWGAGNFKSRIFGRFNMSNLLAVIGAIGHEVQDFQALLDIVEKLESVEGRMQRLNFSQAGPTVFIDYAHTPDGLEKALGSLRAHSKKKLYLVFGCGGDRDKGKRSEMGAVAEALADQIFVTSDNPRSEDPQSIIDDVLAGIKNKSNVANFVDRAKAIEAAIQQATANEIVLIAGKGHESYQILRDRTVHFNDAEEVERIFACKAGFH